MKKLITIALLLLMMVFSACTIDDPGYFVADADSKVQVVDADGDIVTIDSVSRAITVIDMTHHEMHEGDHYYMEGFVTLANGGTFYAKLVTPDSAKWTHLIWDIVSSGILETNFYEGASGGMTGGDVVVPLNSNRNSTNTSGLVITSGVTVATDKGLKVSSKKVGGTGFKTVSGGTAERSDELILKQNTTYFREFISGSDDNVISFRATWYEHTNKD